MKIFPSANNTECVLAKREQFAVSLRKEKKKQILSKKRAKLQYDYHQNKHNLNQFAELHPAFTDTFTTIEDKQRLMMQILCVQTCKWLQKQVHSPDTLLKVLMYINRILGYKMIKAVPSKFFIDHGLLHQTFYLIFNKQIKREES